MEVSPKLGGGSPPPPPALLPVASRQWASRRGTGHELGRAQPREPVAQQTIAQENPAVLGPPEGWRHPQRKDLGGKSVEEQGDAEVSALQTAAAQNLRPRRVPRATSVPAKFLCFLEVGGAIFDRVASSSRSQ